LFGAGMNRLFSPFVLKLLFRKVSEVEVFFSVTRGCGKKDVKRGFNRSFVKPFKLSIEAKNKMTSCLGDPHHLLPSLSSYLDLLNYDTSLPVGRYRSLFQ